MALIIAGATRIGASASVAIVSSCGAGEKKKVTTKDIAKMIDHSAKTPAYRTAGNRRLQAGKGI